MCILLHPSFTHLLIIIIDTERHEEYSGVNFGETLALDNN